MQAWGQALKPARACRLAGQVALPLQGVTPGRARLTLAFGDGSSLPVHYFVLPPFRAHVAKFGAFQASTAWLSPDGRTEDPFGRSRSVMPWDRAAGRHVLQDPRWGPLLCCAAWAY